MGNLYKKIDKASRIFGQGFSEKEKLVQDFISELGRAYGKGYSVVELARVTKCSVRKVYRSLRDYGFLPQLKQRRGCKPPELFQSVLDRTGLAFSQWANSHGLDPQEAEIALDGPVDLYDDSTIQAHNALAVDFPKLYARIYGTEPDTSQRRVRLSDKRERFGWGRDILIWYDFKTWRFVASFDGEEESGIQGIGEDRITAVRGLRTRFYLSQSVIELRLLTARPEPIFRPKWEV